MSLVCQVQTSKIEVRDQKQQQMPPVYFSEANCCVAETVTRWEASGSESLCPTAARKEVLPTVSELGRASDETSAPADPLILAL